MTRLSFALDKPPIGERRRFDPDAGALVGGQCQECGTQTWPLRSVCYRCGSGDVLAATIPTDGRLTTWTRVWVPVEGIKPPYVVGLVTLGSLQIFGHVRGISDTTTVPADVKVRVELESVPPFWFELVA